MLRELLVLAAASGDFRDYERRLAQALLEDIWERYSPELGEEREVAGEERALTWNEKSVILISKINKNRR